MLNLNDYTIDSTQPLLSNSSTDDYLMKLYEFLRTNDPIYWSSYHNAWIITKYQDVCNGLRNTSMYSCRDTQSIITRDLVTQAPEENIIINKNNARLDIEEPKEYLIYRKMVLDYYNSCISNGLENEIFMNIEKLFNDAPKNKEINIIKTITDLIPVMTICYMMGFDYSKVFEVQKISQSFCDVASASERLERYRSAVKFLYQEKPTIFNIKGKKNNNIEYTDDFIIRICLGLFIGGAISMTGGLPGLLYHSSIHNNEFQKVLKNKKLVSNFIQESLRHSFKMSHLVRTASCDHYIGDYKILKSQKVAFMMSSANYDQDIFGKNNLEFKINRNYKKINLIFGHGTYRCIGQAIGVMQLEKFMNFIINNKIDISNITFKQSRDFTGTTYKTLHGIIR